MAANNRIFYATQAVLLKPQNSDGTVLYANYIRPRGVQSVGITTNFTLEQVFQLGQLDLYDQVEDVPEVEVTISKVVDGTLPLYLICVGGSDGPITGADNKDLAAIANNRVNVRLGIFSDTNSAASGSARDYVDCSGMYLSSVSYTFPVDGNATEDVTLVGNNKVWNRTTVAAATTDFGFGNENTAESSAATARRYRFNLAGSVLPSGSGGLPIPTGGNRTAPYLQSVTLSTDLGREAINELGRMAPYFRYATFPVEVTSEFEMVAADGDQIDADDFSGAVGCSSTYANLSNKTIKIKVCGSGTNGTEYMEVDLGTKNKLTSVNYTGGDTGGGNATVTYSFQNFNNFKVNVEGTTFSAIETVT